MHILLRLILESSLTMATLLISKKLNDNKCLKNGKWISYNHLKGKWDKIAVEFAQNILRNFHSEQQKSTAISNCSLHDG